MLSRWMSILVTVIILVTGALGYFAVEQITRREIKLEFDQRVSETQQRLQAAFQAYVSERISILTILTDLYKRGQVPDAAAHAQYADLIMSAIPGFVAINFVDPQFVVRRVYPFESNKEAYLLDYKKYPSRLDPLRESAKWGEIKVADPEPLIQGGVGFMIASPVVDREAKGLIVGVVDVGAMVANLVRPALDKDSGFILRTSEGVPFFTEDEAREAPGALETVKAPLKVGDSVWTIQFGLAAGSVGKAMTLYRTSAAVTGALLVSTLIALLWILRERGASFEQMVVERTDALKGSEEKYRALFLQANEGIVLIDPLNFRVIDANESFENLAGYRTPALQTMSWTDLLVEDERERGRLMLERTVALGAVDRIDLTLRRREGEPVYASFSPALVEVQGGKFIQGTVRDVTDIRRATSEVRRLSAAINATGEHFYIIDLNGTVIFNNRAVELDLGLPADALAGTPISRVFSPEGRDAAETELVGATLRYGSVEREILCARRDGGEFWCRFRTSVVRDEMAKPIYIVAVGSDVTKIREMDRLKTDFISNVSHELRTPLTSIKGFVATLLENEDMEPATRREFLEIMLTESERLYKLIEDLLQISRTEGKPFPLARSFVAVETLVQDVVLNLSPQVVERSMDFRFRVDRGIPEVYVDPGGLKQILVNLLSNALKFTPPGGRVELDVQFADQTLTFLVKDSGIGIPKEDSERIFEKFYRVEGKGRADAPGTGLGLSIVRTIVAAHGGSVEVRSEVGVGSVFIVRLPVTTRAGEAARPASPARAVKG